MKRFDQKVQHARYRPFTQEMQQVFSDWVKDLPFIREEIQEEPERVQEANHAR